MKKKYKIMFLTMGLVFIGSTTMVNNVKEVDFIANWRYNEQFKKHKDTYNSSNNNSNDNDDNENQKEEDSTVEDIKQQSYMWNFNEIEGYECTLYFDTEGEMNKAKGILTNCQLVIIKNSFHLILNDGTDIKAGNADNVMNKVFEVINY